ncbi:MAG: hypothetical protein V1676_06195 [Candidatus Diapherotrites archaeon]
MPRTPFKRRTPEQWKKLIPKIRTRIDTRICHDCFRGFKALVAQESNRHEYDDLGMHCLISPSDAHIVDDNKNIKIWLAKDPQGSAHPNGPGTLKPQFHAIEADANVPFSERELFGSWDGKNFFKLHRKMKDFM